MSISSAPSSSSLPPSLPSPSSTLPPLPLPPSLSSSFIINNLNDLNFFILKYKNEIYFGNFDQIISFYYLSSKIVEGIESCIGPRDIQIKEEIYNQFLLITLPQIIEIYLKRKTLRFI